MNKTLLRLTLKLAPRWYCAWTLRKALARDELDTVKEVIRVCPELVDCSSEARRLGDPAKTPLYLAVLADDVDAVRTFLGVSANPNIRTSDSTPLEWAAILGRRPEHARLLLSAGTDSFAARSAVLESASHGNWQMALFLLSEKAGADAADGRGWTALHHAVERGNRDVADALIRHGADINAATTGTLTVIDLARDSQTRIGPGTTALRLAEWHQPLEPWLSIGKLLRERGGISGGSIF